MEITNMTTTPATRLISPFVRLLMLVVLTLGISATSLASVFVSLAFAPPPLPVYSQPICPGAGFIWIPGYWGYGPDGYYWVPGYWELAPFIGALWTPGYWGWSSGGYLWHAGYWGPHVGFYGGINYGFGYFGVGYAGGYWNRGVFSYNTAVTNVNVNVVHNTYNRTVVENTNVTRVSYNGGTGGITARPTAQEQLALRDRHRAPTSTQLQHERLASTDRGQLASANHGTPSVTATPRASAFNGRGAAPASAANVGAPRHTPPNAQNVRPETHAQTVPHPPQASGAARAGPPQVQHETRVERGSSHVSGGAPRPPNVSNVNPEMHAQRAPHPETRPQVAPGSAHPQTTVRPDTRAQAAPRPEVRAQAAPRPEMHAQAAPHPQGQGAQPRGGQANEQRQEEGRGEGHGAR
jgi:hypothetical protein